MEEERPVRSTGEILNDFSYTLDLNLGIMEDFVDMLIPLSSEDDRNMIKALDLLHMINNDVKNAKRVIDINDFIDVDRLKLEWDSVRENIINKSIDLCRKLTVSIVEMGDEMAVEDYDSEIEDDEP